MLTPSLFASAHHNQFQCARMKLKHNMKLNLGGGTMSDTVAHCLVTGMLDNIIEAPNEADEIAEAVWLWWVQLF